MRDTIPCATDIKKAVRKYDEKYNTNKFDN